MLSLSLSLSLNMLLCLSLLPLYLVPHSVLPVVISCKYADYLMRGYHINKLIEPKWLFHLGITHNDLHTSKRYIHVFTSLPHASNNLGLHI